MHMKYDYYNHTNVFKLGYNVQKKYTTSNRGRSARIVPALEKMHTEIDEYIKSEEGMDRDMKTEVKKAILRIVVFKVSKSRKYHRKTL